MTKKTTKKKRENPHLGEDFDVYLRRKLADPVFAEHFEDEGGKYDLAHRVRDLREAAGLSQAEVAERMGTKQPSIARIERAEAWPKIETLQKLARVFGMRLQIDFVPAPRKRRSKKKVAAARASVADEARPAAR
jgi:ribosome-binding protein aMBF1 (putative translation factor)